MTPLLLRELTGAKVKEHRTAWFRKREKDKEKGFTGKSRKAFLFFFGSGGRTRTGMRLPSADFESAMSTIPSLRQSCYL